MLRAAELLKAHVPLLDQKELQQFVAQLLDRREGFLAAVREHGSPLYLLDTDTLRTKAHEFKRAFAHEIDRLQVFYALKSNCHPDLARVLVEEGLGLDVSSGKELELGLDLGTQPIIFSGPGKQDTELQLAVANRERVTVLMDSFGELERLERIAGQTGVRVRAGVRLTTDESGIWRKFGIPLDDLKGFFSECEDCQHVQLAGLQFHLSWNLDSTAHVIYLARLGAALWRLPEKYRSQIEFIDIGGGFWPEQGEWLQRAATPQGIFRDEVTDPMETALEHYKRPALPITEFAANIGKGLRKHLQDMSEITVWTEPGRWLCNDALHLLLTVIDRKTDEIVVTDGGTNAVGWERFETDYFPVINLTRPHLTERRCLVAGSLCTPHDIWGYGYFGEDIRPGDVLLIPNQGAYTYSLRQEFIKPLPKSVELRTEPGLKPANSASDKSQRPESIDEGKSRVL